MRFHKDGFEAGSDLIWTLGKGNHALLSGCD
jgi:hypothetical protein